MIRRGLQILIVGITALGAAPLHAQTLPSWWVWPAQVVVTGLPVTLGTDPNGLYVNTGVLTPTGYIYGRYTVDGSSAGWEMDLRYYSASRVFWTIRKGGDLFFIQDNIPATNFQNLPYTISPIRTWNGIAQANSMAIFQAPPPPDPYEEAFPDWESAGVKIPLGFSFGMSVWAAFLAGTIALKWVRELSSAAT